MLDALLIFVMVEKLVLSVSQHFRKLCLLIKKLK